MGPGYANFSPPLCGVIPATRSGALHVPGAADWEKDACGEAGTPKSRAVAAALGREDGFLRLGKSAEIKIPLFGRKNPAGLASRGFLALAPRGGWGPVVVVWDGSAAGPGDRFPGKFRGSDHLAADQRAGNKKPRGNPAVF